MPDHQTRLAEILSDTMKLKGVSILELSKDAGVTYETIRGIMCGERHPSPTLLRLICVVLHLDFADVAPLAAADEIERKYGVVPAILAGKNPEMAPLERYWPNLTADQKNELTQCARDWSKHNRLREVQS